jgi:predicted aldo/keto reductase-like oxidoreductase
MKRRTFLKHLTVAAASVATRGAWPVPALPSASIPKRALGKTGIQLPVIGFSGLVARDNTPEAVDRAVGESLDLGINYFDMAASYGNAEAMLSPVLRPRRKDIILSTKTRERTREGAQAQFRQSCELLGTDYFDLYLVHGIQRVDKDVEPAFATGGAMEFCLDAKKSGQIRLLGFSAHSTEAALLAMERYTFDFFYFPVSYAPWYKSNFGVEVLAKARERGIPCIALKALARQHWPQDVPKETRCDKCWYQPIDDPAEAALAVRWAFSQDVVSILPPGNEQRYRAALGLAANLAPPTPAEAEHLKSLAATMTPLFPRPK